MSYGKSWFYGVGAWLYELIHHLNTLWTDDRFRRLVAEMASIGPNDRVLDVGTGTGLTAIKLASHKPCHILALDISEEMLSRARTKIKKLDMSQVTLVRGNAENLPFASSCFSRLVSCYGLGGVPDSKAALKELVRVAEPGALIVVAEIVAPPLGSLRWFIHKHFAEPLLVKGIWGFRDLELLSLFEESGIQVTEHRFYAEKIFGSTMLVLGRVH